MARKKSGWYGERKRHSEASRKGAITRKKRKGTYKDMINEGMFGSGGWEQYKIYAKRLSLRDVARFNSHLRIAKAKGNSLRGGDVEKIYWLEILGKSREEYAKYLNSLD